MQYPLTGRCPPNVRAASALRGKRPSWAHTMICVSRGPGLGAWRLAEPVTKGRDARCPCPGSLHSCPIDRQGIKGSHQPANASRSLSGPAIPFGLRFAIASLFRELVCPTLRRHRSCLDPEAARSGPSNGDRSLARRTSGTSPSSAGSGDLGTTTSV
jgi:hypothetical protein